MHIPKRQERVATLLQRLAAAPPQVLLLEGGDAPEREALGLFWAARLNCAGPGAPCGVCRSCTQVQGRTHPDLVFFDGGQDKIKIEDVRELRPLLGQAPRGNGLRVVLFHEAQELTPQAANALLKSLEEPSRSTVFALLAPQREWLLPTLVSRSWTLTLAWPGEPEADPALGEWLGALMDFWRTGQGWFRRTGVKGAVDKHLAMALVLALQREIARTLCERTASPVAQGFAKLPPARLKHIDLALAHAQDALSLPTPVNPALVLDWLATHVHKALRARA